MTVHWSAVYWLPVHRWSYPACGSSGTLRFTADPEAVTCGGCRRTSRWRVAVRKKAA